MRGCRCFETGSVDEFRFSLPHLGELTKVRLLARISARYAMRRSAQRSAARLEIARSDLLAYAVYVGTGSAAYPT